MMISNAISTTMMTSRRSDRFVLMMSVSIFAVSEMTASLRDSGVGAFLELVFGDLTLVARQHRAFRKRVRNHDHAFWCNCLEQDRAPRQDLLVLVGNDLEGGVSSSLTLTGRTVRSCNPRTTWSSSRMDMPNSTTTP
jgi:hypothetical protein